MILSLAADSVFTGGRYKFRTRNAVGKTFDLEQACKTTQHPSVLGLENGQKHHIVDMEDSLL
jgi:hypothetical protein